MSSSFAAGFFGQLNNDIVDRKQYIRTRVEEDRLYLREQGLKRQAGVQEQRQDYEKIARSLINRGGDESLIISTLEMDPAGLMQVYTQAERDNTTGNGINDMMSIAEDNRSTSSMQEVLDRILPTIQEMPANTDPVTSRRRSLGAFLGLDLDAELSNEVYNSEIIAGMTGDQIMSSLNLPIDAQGSNVGGVTFDLSGPTAALSVQDRNTYLRGIMDSYNLPTRIDALKASKEGKTGIELESIDTRIKTLEGINAMPSGQGFNSIVSLIGQEGYEDLTLSQYTMDIAKEPYGPQVFMAPGIFPEVRERLMGSSGSPSATPSDTPDNGVGASDNLNEADVADSVVTPEVGVSLLDEPGARTTTTDTPPASEIPAVPVTSANADRVVASYMNDNPDSPGLYVMFTGDPSAVYISRETDYVEDLTVDSGKTAYREALASVLDVPDNARAGLIANQAEIMGERPAVEANDPLVVKPTATPPTDSQLDTIAERDELSLRKLLVDEDASPEELKEIIAAFRQVYGDVATDIILNQIQSAR